MNDLQQQVLVRLSDGPLTVSEVNAALAHGMVDKKCYFSPGVDAVTATLSELEAAGVAHSQGDDAWQLTEAGWTKFDGLAKMFRLSSGYGHYGF